MKKTFRYIYLIIILFYSNMALSGESFYHIDIDFVLNNSLAGKSIIKQLENKDKSNKDKFKKNETELKKKETKLISQKSILEKKEFNEKVALFAKEVSIYKKERADILNNFSKKKNIAQKELLEKLTIILGKYSEEKSISYILSRQNIIVGKKELDLTNIIIEILNKEIKTIKLN